MESEIAAQLRLVCEAQAVGGCVVWCGGGVARFDGGKMRGEDNGRKGGWREERVRRGEGEERRR